MFVAEPARGDTDPTDRFDPDVAASVHGSLHARVVLAFAVGTVSPAQTKSGSFKSSVLSRHMPVTVWQQLSWS